MSTVLLWFLQVRLGISTTAHVYDANTVVINTIYRCVLSVLLAELHSYAYTGHCSHVFACTKKSIDEIPELSIL